MLFVGAGGRGPGRLVFSWGALEREVWDFFLFLHEGVWWFGYWVGVLFWWV